MEGLTFNLSELLAVLGAASGGSWLGIKVALSGMIKNISEAKEIGIRAHDRIDYILRDGKKHV